MTLHSQPQRGQFEPKYEIVDFVDVARKLSRLRCYGGRTREFYSEAERSVRLASLMPQYKLYGLLHDVPKAFSGSGSNAPSNIAKRTAIGSQVFTQLGIPPLDPHYHARHLMRWADDLLFVTEHRDVLLGLSEKWRPKHEYIVPTYWRIEPWSAEQAEWRFIYELEQALHHADIDIPHNVREFLGKGPDARGYALPVSRGEIRGFAPKDLAEEDDWVEAQIRHNAYTLVEQPTELPVCY